jgi:unsaturated chondroitin disaccharide hydrolase
VGRARAWSLTAAAARNTHHNTPPQPHALPLRALLPQRPKMLRATLVLAAAHSAAARYAPLLEAAAAKATATAAALGADYLKYPSNSLTTAPYGAWSTSGADGWTSGFWPAHLLRLYNATGTASFRTLGEAWAQGLIPEDANTGTHDVGFIVYTPWKQILDDRGAATNARAILLETAASLATRYNPTVGCFRSWGNRDAVSGPFEVIVDNLMNLELIWWAATETNNATLLAMGKSHVLHTIRDLIQPPAVSSDGGAGCAWHLVVYDEVTGRVISRSSTPQGLGNNTVWARGQSWVVNGLTIAYRFTRDAAHLAGAQAAAECFMRRLLACCGTATQYKGAPKWDFNVPDTAPVNKVDTSAAMIAAEGLAELSGYVSAADGARYLQFATMLVDAVVANYMAPPESPALISNGTVRFRERAPREASARAATRSRRACECSPSVPFSALPPLLRSRIRPRGSQSFMVTTMRCARRRASTRRPRRSRRRRRRCRRCKRGQRF